jgi:hypothetical protein
VSLFSALGGWWRLRTPPDAALLAAIERLVDLVDPALRNARGYARKLETPVQHALNYCSGLVAALPGPVDINQRAFASDKRVHALFATAADISLLLGESPSLRDYLAEPASAGSGELYALLAARRCTKRVLGYVMEGDDVRADVPQELLYFTAHTLIETGGSLDALRQALRTATFESLGQSFRAHVDALRQERSGLQGDRSLAQAHLTVLRGKTDDAQYAVRTRRIAQLDASLRGAVESLMPGQLLAALASNLQQPEQLLRLEPVALAVDRAGVLVDSAEAKGVPTLEFFELTSRDRRRNVTLLVRIQRQDAAASVEAAKVRRDRFVII